MQTPSAMRIALLGAIVIAITYGLARFVLGLFLPLIRDDLGLSAIEAGLVGALPFTSFIVAIVVAPQLSEWIGPRRAGALTVALAAAGLIIIASAPNGMVLALAVALCGISTGLSSPVLADAVSASVTPALRARVNAVHNAGTSIGVAGLAGGAVGDLIDRFGAKATHTATLALLSLALLVLARFPELISIGIVSAAAFGMAYMMLTGLYLVQGVRILGSRPALGPVLPFLAIACGQAIGSPLAGWFIDEAGYTLAFVGFAAIGGLATISGLLVMKPVVQRAP